MAGGVMATKVKIGSVNWGKCELIALGIDMKCPLCGTDVPSGHVHECERDGGITTQRTRKLPKASK
jgi:hypothetical protein